MVTLLTIWLLSVTQVVSALSPGGTLSLSFSFASLDGALASGNDCDVFDSCDLYFVICVKTEGNRGCDIFNTTTSRITNVGNVTFDDETMLQFSFKAPANKIYLIIEAWDHDIVTNDDFVGRVEGLALIENIKSHATPLNLHRSSTFYKNDFRINASMKKICNPSFSGSLCQFFVERQPADEIIDVITTSESFNPLNAVPSSSGSNLSGGGTDSKGNRGDHSAAGRSEVNPRCERARELIGDEVCLNRGICRDSPDGTSYACYCSHGYSGSRCELLDFCFNITCSGHGQCRQFGARLDNFVCECEPGWKGVLCEISYLNACEAAFYNLPKDQLSICLHGGICVEHYNGSSFYCQCTNGWLGERCGTHFTQTVAFIVPLAVISSLLILTWICVCVCKNFRLKLVMNSKKSNFHVRPVVIEGGFPANTCRFVNDEPEPCKVFNPTRVTLKRSWFAN
ncbi:neurogenic locus notch protein 4 [Echinococcus multilocularis]|uniref:Neurogenic locus notch protein 4 n=1 Tax=Echinococcus multilocularis TaxID=6211 RepID=A0A068Y8R6_ECHMU|nr:neurogenic locus notch protein 4 [Echinococcus multilocularis]